MQELFIQELAKACCEQAATVNEHSMVYQHLAKVVQTDSRLGFLQGVMSILIMLKVD